MSSEPTVPPIDAIASLRILLIEDNQDDAHLAKYELARSRRGHFVLEWRTTLALGMECLKTDGFDVVLLDLALPDSRGLATFEKLNAAFRQVPIIVLTGYDDEETALQSVRMGAQDYLVKGQFDGDNLGRAVTYAIERARAAREVATLAEELAQRNAVLEEELRLAHQIQRAWLPDPLRQNLLQENIESRPWKLAHRYVPTESLAGDFFKAYPLNDGQVGVLICDIMGYGVRSALIAAMLNGLIEEFEYELESPGLLLTRLNMGLNRVLGPARAKIFATACYMVIDPHRRHIKLANAGHPGPYLLRHATGAVEQIVPNRGPALGLFEEAEFPEVSAAVDSEDVVLLYTDGITEVEGNDGEFFDNRIAEALGKRMGQPLDELLDGLIAEAKQFSSTGEFHDDVCLIAVEIGRGLAGVANRAESET